MPVVPVYPGQQVAPSISAPRVAVDAPVESFAAGTAIRGADVSNVQRAVSDLYQQQQQKADQVALLDADNQLADLGISLQSAALGRQGKDALGATQDANAQWQQATAAIGNGLSNDRQKLAFQARADSRWNALHEVIERHADTELQKYDDETTSSALTNRTNDAIDNYQDPARVAQAIAEQQAIVADYGARHGLSPESIQEQTAATVSKTHVGVIDRMLANQQDLTASAYYEAHKDQIVGSDAIPLERALDEGSIRGESQRQSDAIASTTTSLGDALKQAQQIQDPKIRDAVEDRLRQNYADRATNERQMAYQAFQDAGDILERTHSLDAIPPKTWLALSVEDRGALQRRLEQIRNPERVTDPETYYKLMNMAALNPATMAQFQNLDLSKYRPQLSDGDFHQLVELQLSIRRSAIAQQQAPIRRAATAAAVAAAKQQQALQTLHNLGIDSFPVAPGGPLRMPTSGPAAPILSTQRPKVGPTVVIPQAWRDAAKSNPDYKAYLDSLGHGTP